MKSQARTLVVGATLLALGLWLLAAGGRGLADDKADLRGSIEKAAAAIEKGDMPEAKRIADEIGKSSVEIEAVMNLMGKRIAASGKGGLGVGKKPGGILPDGIELKIIDLAKKALPPARLDKESEALVELGYRVAAIAEVAKAKPPEKDEAGKTKKDWLEFADGMRKAADGFIEAAKEKKGPAIKAAASKLNASCTNCHSKFRDS
jgi:hypothetical protein